jgi:hypothetical protein
MTTAFAIEATTPSNHLPHLTTVEAIRAFPAVPTLVGAPSADPAPAAPAPDTPASYPIDPSSTAYMLMSLAWSKRESAIMKAESEFTQAAKQVAGGLRPMAKQDRWKMGVDLGDDDQLRFALLVWP